MLFERRLIAGLSGTENGQLKIAIEHFRQDMQKQIQTFLIGQTRNHAGQRQPLVDGKAKFGLESSFADGFAFRPICPVIICRYGRVGRRIVDRIVNAIEDSGQFVCLTL